MDLQRPRTIFYDLDSLILFLRRLAQLLEHLQNGRGGGLCLVLADVDRCGGALREIAGRAGVPDDWPPAPARSARDWLDALTAAGVTLERAARAAQPALDHVLKLQLDAHRALVGETPSSPAPDSVDRLGAARLALPPRPARPARVSRRRSA